MLTTWYIIFSGLSTFVDLTLLLSILSRTGNGLCRILCAAPPRPRTMMRVSSSRSGRSGMNERGGERGRHMRHCSHCCHRWDAGRGQGGIKGTQSRGLAREWVPVFGGGTWVVCLW
jgi:hypothetical protein